MQQRGKQHRLSVAGTVELTVLSVCLQSIEYIKVVGVVVKEVTSCSSVVEEQQNNIMDY